MANSLFSDTFVTQLTTVLNDKCKDGKAISSAALCAELGLDPAFRNTLSIAINSGLVPNYKINKGKGVYLEGSVVPKKVKKASAPTVKTSSNPFAVTTTGAARPSNLTDEFVDQLVETLNKLCAVSDRPVPRKQVAEEMGMPGTKTELMVSAAMKLEKLSNFAIRAGRSGGIVFAAEAQVEEDDTEVVELPEVELPEADVSVGMEALLQADVLVEDLPSA